jgi:hypothetical protein
MGDGWAWVSLSAHADGLTVAELATKLPGGQINARGGYNNDVVSVNLSEAHRDAPLSDLLEELARYLTQNREQLLALHGKAQFQVRIGWSPRSPQECLVVPAALISSLAELGTDIMLDGYGE